MTMPSSNGQGELFKSLLEFAKSADLEEVAWEKGEQRIAFKRRLPQISAVAAPQAPAPAAKPVQLQIITSPMVGTFWRASSKDRPPLVVEGGMVSVGQRVAQVEAMKIPKDVISNVAGRITRILAENGRPVEYGQKLFEVEVE